MGEASPLFISERTVARLLGHDVKWLKENAEMLERTTGFPKIDPVINKRHREAVEVWARNRNIRKAAGHERLTETNRENNDAF